MDTAHQAREDLLTLSRGFEISQCIFAAVELGLADFLAERPYTAEELALATGTDNRALPRLLQVLVHLKILAVEQHGEDQREYFVLQDMGQYLRSDSDKSMRDFLLMRAEQDYHVWSGLTFSLRQGRSAHEHIFGMSRYAYLKQNPEAGRRFDRAMDDLSRRHSCVIVSAYDFSGANKIVDIGGGEGQLLATLLNANAHLRGTLVEQGADTLAQAKRAMEALGLVERCTFIHGDFFVEVPNGGDVYILKHVLHNWDHAQALSILRNCREAMTDDSRLLVIERLLIPSPNIKGSLLNLRMLVAMPGGHLRSEDEFRQLLDAAGLKLHQVYPTALEFSILEVLPKVIDAE